MLRKIAVALIATSMLAAPVLAADAVKTTPATATHAAVDSKANAAVKPAPIVKAPKSGKLALRHHRLHRHHAYVAKHARPRIHMTAVKTVKSVGHAKVIKATTNRVVKSKRVPASKRPTLS
jgi:hypothetical protein